MRGSAVFRTGIAPGGALAGPWVRNPLWTRARAVPSLDLRFADNKSLVDATTGASLVTFTRASSGTYVGSDGLIKSAVTNLLVQSEDFSTTWTNTESTEASNVETAPNGTLTADKLIPDVGVTSGQFRQDVSKAATATTYTCSVYGKAAEFNRLSIRVEHNGSTGNRADVGFSLSDGSVVSAAAALGTFSGASATATSVGAGWYRFTLSFTSSTETSIRVRLFGFDSSLPCNGTSGIYLWGAQLEQASTVGEYIPTTSTINSAPRFDHNPTTGESLGLLVEEARTNLVRNNTMVGAVAGSPGTPPTNGWLIVNNATYTSSILGTGTENGINYIDIQYVVAAAAPAATLFYCDTPAASALTAYTGSYYLKLISGTIPQVRFIWQDGISTYNRTFFTLTSTLTRYTDTLTTAVLANLARFAVGIDAAPSGATFVIRIGLPQVEQGAFATSPILTSSATVTRAADVASITGTNFSSWYNQTEGTIYSAATATSSTSSDSTAAAVGIAAFTDGTNAERIRYGALTFSTVWVDNNTSQANLSSGAFTQNQQVNLASAFKLNNFALVRDGGSVQTDATGTLPTLTQVELGRSGVGTGLFTGTIKRLAYWGQRLANPTLQSITAP